MTLHNACNTKRTALAVLFFWCHAHRVANHSIRIGANLSPQVNCRRPVGTGLWRAVGIGCLWLSLSCSIAAQSVIYRCGHEYTNAPRDTHQCQRLTEQAVTVISGVRPPSARTGGAPDGPVVDEARTKAEPSRPVTAVQSERDAQARTVLEQELARLQQQHQRLVHEYNQSMPAKWAAEQSDPLLYPHRVAALKAAMDRTERDIDSLQRELARRPLAVKTLKP